MCTIVPQAGCVWRRIKLVATIAFRVIYVWLYVGAGRSVFAVILLHAIGNVGRSLFPGGRAAYELGDGVIGYGLIVLVALCVALRWRPHAPVVQR